MPYESYRMTFQDSEQAARFAYNDAERFYARLRMAHEALDEVQRISDASKEGFEQDQAKCLDDIEEIARNALKRLNQVTNHDFPDPPASEQIAAARELDHGDEGERPQSCGCGYWHKPSERCGPL